MLRQGDLFVFYGILIFVILLFVRRTLKQQRKDPLPFLSVPNTTKRFSGDVVSLLEEKGYKVISDKVKVPISIVADGKQMESRLFVDYLAEKDGLLYVVKVGKDRKPLLFNGAALREQLLHYFLLYRPKGILYVSEDKKDIKIVQFELGNEVKDVRFNGKSAIFWFCLGMIITAIIIK